jgi:hypothetical protein
MTAAKTIAVRTGAVLCSIWLGGCISQPQTAAEFRNGVAIGIAGGATKDTFEVNRPLTQVGASFRRLASECLDRTIRGQLTRHGYVSLTTTFKPTVHVSSSRVELQVQVSQGGIQVIKGPKGGTYYLIADARPVGAAKTHIDLYTFPLGSGQLVRAVHDWASGTSAACPD